MPKGIGWVLLATLWFVPASSALSDPAPAGNPYLSGGRRLYANLEFEAALDQLQRARAYPNSTPEEVVQISLYLGLVQFGMGNDAAARTEFRSAMALDPQVTLPGNVSPKISREWEGIRREMALVDRQSAHPVATPAPTTPPDSPPSRPNLAPLPRADPAQTALAPAPPEHSMVATAGPFVVLGIGVAMAGVGSIFGLSANDASHAAGLPSTSQVAAQADNRSAQRDAAVANTLFAAAGAAAVGGVVWLLAR